MSDLVTYSRDDDAVATITMDDGKVNALTLRLLTQLNDALDRAAADDVAVVLTGRGTVFCAGFDLPTIRGGGFAAGTLLRAAFETCERLLAFPAPVVGATPGHAIAMGLFLLQSCDHVIGADGPFKIVANEVAIGMTMPNVALPLVRRRLAPSHLERVVILAEPYRPSDAVTAGLLDRVVAPEELLPTARDVASTLATLDRTAHARTKLRVRADTLAAMRAALAADTAEMTGTPM